MLTLCRTDPRISKYREDAKKKVRSTGLSIDLQLVIHCMECVEHPSFTGDIDIPTIKLGTHMILASGSLPLNSCNRRTQKSWTISNWQTLGALHWQKRTIRLRWLWKCLQNHYYRRHGEKKWVEKSSGGGKKTRFYLFVHIVTLDK